MRQDSILGSTSLLWKVFELADVDVDQSHSLDQEFYLAGGLVYSMFLTRCSNLSDAGVLYMKEKAEMPFQRADTERTTIAVDVARL